jgi:hypothetical protein
MTMALSKENITLIRETVNAAGDLLKGKLRPLPDIPNRNSYAHVWKAIKEKLGMSYKDASDADVPQMLEIINEAVADALTEFEVSLNNAH